MRIHRKEASGKTRLISGIGYNEQGDFQDLRCVHCAWATLLSFLRLRLEVGSWKLRLGNLVGSWKLEVETGNFVGSYVWEVGS